MFLYYRTVSHKVRSPLRRPQILVYVPSNSTDTSTAEGANKFFPLDPTPSHDGPPADAPPNELDFKNNMAEVKFRRTYL